MSDETPRTLAILAQDSHRVSKAHGFWDAPETPETIPSKLMLIVSELSEALESHRDPRSDEMVKVPADVVEAILTIGLSYGNDEQAVALDALNEIYESWKAKPRGFDIEIADALIRIGDLVGQQGIDIDAAIERKQNYNETRPYKHNRIV